MAAFREIITLRDHPELASLPTLQQILEDNETTSTILRYAATQALFTAGTEAEYRLLDRHAARPDFDGRLAFEYAFHWDMAPGGRDRYLDRFVLGNGGEAPTLSLRAVDAANIEKGALAFDLDFRNSLEHAIEILDPASFMGEHLVFRSVGGHISNTVCLGTDVGMGAKVVQLAPGGACTLRAVVKFMAPADSPGGRHPGLPDGASVVGRCGSFTYLLGQPGVYDVVAFWTARGRRGVSPAVRVQVPPPQ